jgi:type I restriction enzyme R subunit
VTGPEDPYLAREATARKNIDRQLAAAGWVVQHADRANVSAGPWVAVREFVLEKAMAGSTISFSLTASRPG